VFEKILTRQIIEPLRTLALETAGRIDREEGEMPSALDGDEPFADAIEKQVYGQPVLKRSEDEREPFPYRRDDDDVKAGNSDISSKPTGTLSSPDEQLFFDCEEGVEERKSSIHPAYV
jgi:hypothetical protein